MHYTPEAPPGALVHIIIDMLKEQKKSIVLLSNLLSTSFTHIQFVVV